MVKLIGIISFILLIVLFIIILLLVYPKLFLRFGYSRSIVEGEKSKDRSYYLPEKKYADVIEKYELVKNLKSHKKFAVITLKPHVNVASFALYLFDVKGKCFNNLKVSFSKVDQQVNVEVDSKTFGLNIIPISSNENEFTDYNESGVKLFRSKIALYSIVAAITSAVFSFLSSLSLSLIIVPKAPFYVFSLLNIGIYILMIILVMILVGVGSYFTIFFTNRKYIDEAFYE